MLNIKNESPKLTFKKNKNNDVNILEEYKKRIEPLIIKELNSSRKPYIHEKTLFGDNSSENIRNLEISHQIRQKQMKEGNIGQIVLGNFINWTDLKQGHESGLDCMKNDNSIIIEVKNKYNTCNANSQKAILDKLAKYKKNYPNTRCVWGILNPKKNEKKLTSIIYHNGVELEKIQGRELLKLVFVYNNQDYSDEILKFARKIIKYN